MLTLIALEDDSGPMALLADDGRGLSKECLDVSVGDNLLGEFDTGCGGLCGV